MVGGGGWGGGGLPVLSYRGATQPYLPVPGIVQPASTSLLHNLIQPQQFSYLPAGLATSFPQAGLKKQISDNTGNGQQENIEDVELEQLEIDEDVGLEKQEKDELENSENSSEDNVINSFGKIGKTSEIYPPQMNCKID